MVLLLSDPCVATGVVLKELPVNQKKKVLYNVTFNPSTLNYNAINARLTSELVNQWDQWYLLKTDYTVCIKSFKVEKFHKFHR